MNFGPKLMKFAELLACNISKLWETEARFTRTLYCNNLQKFNGFRLLRVDAQRCNQLNQKPGTNGAIFLFLLTNDSAYFVKAQV